MLRIADIKLTPEQGGSKKTERDMLKLKAAKMLRVSVERIKSFKISKKSIDARDKSNIYYVYSVDVEVENKSGYLKDKNAVKIAPFKYTPPKARGLNTRPVVVGSGPAGLFAAYIFAECGQKPIVLERGKDVDRRVSDVEHFFKTGRLNPESNVQFGEGGAGTFSDGKLTAGTKDVRAEKVFRTFLENHAPDEIAYQAKPHIGTDMLVNALRSMREKIISMGGEFRFEHKMVGINHKNGALCGLDVRDESGGHYTLETENAVIAVGHSARDTFEMLHASGVLMKPKPFAVGVRIEHAQGMINESQYGRFASLLPPADYKLTHRTEDGRGVYTFCMCPGGLVIPASSEDGLLAVNGMSYFRRDAENANSAVLVTVTPEDFGGTGALAGIEFQRGLERRAFEAGGGGHKAPVQLMKDFLNGVKSTSIGSVKPSIPTSYTLCDLNGVLEPFIAGALKEGFAEMDRRVRGFACDDAVLTAVESRSSSPLTIIRDAGMQSSVSGLYPCGEGSGHAGGIVSAAVDGIRCAESVLIGHSGEV